MSERRRTENPPAPDPLRERLAISEVMNHGFLEHRQDHTARSMTSVTEYAEHELLLFPGSASARAYRGLIHTTARRVRALGHDERRQARKSWARDAMARRLQSAVVSV